MSEGRPTSKGLHVVVATDLSDAARCAVARACILAHEHGGAVTALHVALPEETEYEPDEAEGLLDGLLASVRAEVGDIDTRSAVAEGRAFIEIIRFARRVDADLIVVGAHGSDAGPVPLLGTTAERVVRKADRPVLVVRTPTTEPYRRLMVGVDLSAASEDALDMARVLAPGAELDVVHAYALTGWKKLHDAGAGEHERRQLSRQLEATATERVMEVLHRRGLSRADVSVLVHEGPATALLGRLTVQRSTDLLAVGTSGASMLSQVLLGSVAEHALRDAPCDVLTVRHGVAQFELP